MTKVLIIDDDLAIQDIYKKGLEKKGFEVLQAFNGQSGIEKAASQKPDVILLDILMPWMDGLTALRKLKANEKTKDTPVVIITNFGQGEYIKKAFDLGVEEFVLKYRTMPDELGRKIKKVLNKKT